MTPNEAELTTESTGNTEKEIQLSILIILSKKSLFEFNALLVFYAVGFVGEINHLKTFATFLGGRSMSVVQG